MQREISAIFGKGKVLLRETKRAVTPMGGLSVLVVFLKKVGWAEQVRQWLPIHWKSPNAIEAGETLTAFMVAVAAGARRFAHVGWLRADRAVQALLGMKRFPTDGTVCNLFKAFTQKRVTEFYAAMWSWQLERIPAAAEGYSLDLDSTVFERYGKQEGAKKGYNPRKPGRASHHPLLAVLGEIHFVLHGWLRSGNTASARGVVEFLKEALALLGERARIRLVRADSGFFDQALLTFLEQRQLLYIVVVRMTPWLKREATHVKEWRPLDADYAVGEFRLKLQGWDRERRFVVVRERLREKKSSLGRRLIEVPGYTFRIFVTNDPRSPEEIWRDYNGRATIENRISELKYDLAADDFCLQEFYATEAAFRTILMLFNLLGELQRQVEMTTYRRPATLRTQVFVCGAILGRDSRRTVLRLSQSWGGLQGRNELMNKILAYAVPTSPKLNLNLSS